MGKFSDFTFSGASFKRTLLSFFIILTFFFLSANTAEEKSVSEAKQEPSAETVAEDKDKTIENIDKSENNANPAVYTKVIYRKIHTKNRDRRCFKI